MHKFFCRHVFALRLGRNLRVKLLGPVVSPCLTFQEAARLCQSGSPPSTREFQFLHVLPRLARLLILAVLAVAKCYLLVVLLPISLMANLVEEIFMCVLAICLFLW